MDIVPLCDGFRRGKDCHMSTFSFYYSWLRIIIVTSPLCVNNQTCVIALRNKMSMYHTCGKLYVSNNYGSFDGDRKKPRRGLAGQNPHMPVQGYGQKLEQSDFEFLDREGPEHNNSC